MLTEFLVSKETVLLHRWESEHENLVLSNESYKTSLITIVRGLER